ncbi:MAG: TrbI/VirB10 family protein, partial [Bdellovibrionales bacterium]|nr:TrbI/VirB10 family protein [Bdellovibrionales bacterium]NQZ19837.1 TrbI/VirB10 family protein [Bdellovibrionales bacterium]
PSKYRPQVKFTKVVLPDGNLQNIQAVGADFKDKIAGLRGSKVGHYGLKLAASTGLHFVAGLSEGMRNTQIQNGIAIPRPDAKNAALNGLGQASVELARETMSEFKNQKPTFNIPFGTKLYILFAGK